MDRKIIIALTGTPGTGKSTVGRILKKKRLAVINLNLEIRKRKLYSGYDRKRKTYIADMKKTVRFLREELKKEKYQNKPTVIDSHLSHLLPSSLVNSVVVLRCKSEELEKRLKRKKWNKEKIRENFEAEIIGLISYEAKERHGKVFEIDTTKLASEQIAEKIVRIAER